MTSAADWFGDLLPVAQALLGGVATWIPKPLEMAEGPRTSWEPACCWCSPSRSHNTPEGLAVGVSFAAVADGLDPPVTLVLDVALG